MNSEILQQVQVLDVDQQIELAEAIWDGIVAQGSAPTLTSAQADELDKRLADHIQHPEKEVPWVEVKSAALEQIKR